MTATFRPVRVRTGSEDREGRLVFIGDELVAVLVRLDDDVHGPDTGKWFVEASFGMWGMLRAPLFSGLAEVEQWLLADHHAAQGAGPGHSPPAGSHREPPL